MATLINFFERSPFMSVELLDILGDFRIVCYEDDYLYRLLKSTSKVISYKNSDQLKKIGNDDAVKIMLADEAFMSEIKNNNSSSKAIFFYMDSEIDELLKKAGMLMVLPKYDFVSSRYSPVLYSIAKYSRVYYSISNLYEDQESYCWNRSF